LHHGDRNRLCGARLDRAQHARIAERRHIALLLQLETPLVDAARRVDRQHQLQVDGGLGERRCTDAAGKQQRRREAEGNKGWGQVHRWSPNS
jgi:hypothetical protein